MYVTKERRKIPIPCLSTIEFVEINQILAIQANENYSILILQDDSQLFCTLPFGKLVKKLNASGFYQCHKSYAINLAATIRYYRHGEVELSNGKKVPVARRRKSEFMEMWG